jgi:NADPH:quinone reductase
MTVIATTCILLMVANHSAMAYQYLGATHYGLHRDVLQWKASDTLPHCRENQVLIRVQYVELNPVDLQKLLPSKAGQAIQEREAPLIVGYGGAGFVVHSRVDGFEENDEVVFLADPKRSGAYSTHVVVDARCVTKIPIDYPMVMAATLPLSGCTAFESLEKLSLAQAGNLLIVGGAGGVGSWATLLARAKYPSLDILCTASSDESKRWCLENGASSVMAHDEILQKFEGGPKGSVDRILCLTEPTPAVWKALTEVVRPYGTLCLVVAGPSISSLDLGFCFFKAVTVTTETVFSSQRTNYSHSVPSRHMEEMLRLLVSRAISRAPLTEDAGSWKDCLKEGGVLDRLASGHVRGKLVMKVD